MKVNAIIIRVNTRISMILESEKIHESQCYKNKSKYMNVNAIRIRENTRISMLSESEKNT